MPAPTAEALLGLALEALAAAASRFEDLPLWGSSPAWDGMPVLGGSPEGAVKVGPGGLVRTDEELDAVSGHGFERMFRCPLDGAEVSVVSLVLEVSPGPHGVQSRLLLNVQRPPGVEAGGPQHGWMPMTEWAPLSALTARLAFVWEGVLAIVRRKMREGEIAALLVGGGMLHALPWIDRPARIVIDGGQCPCEVCQEEAIWTAAAGGEEARVAARARVEEINARLGQIQPDLFLGWEPDVVEECSGCGGTHIGARGIVTDNHGKVVWASGGESAAEALDAIEGWAWAALVADKAVEVPGAAEA
jgi:hypothetical protein